MSFLEIFTYSLLLLLIINYIRKKIQASKIKHYSSEEAKGKLKNPSVVLLDVRTDQERKSNKINNSLHIPLNQLSGRIDELNKFKSKEFICYCRSGNRSVSAAVMLNKKGFNASNLRGGINRWNFSEK